MAEIWNLDTLVSQPIPFIYRGEDYVLKPASEELTVRFRSSQLRDAKMIDGKLSANIERISESQAILVAGCVFPASTEKSAPISLQTIKGWDAVVVKELFEKVKLISGLEEKETKAELEKKVAELQEQIDNYEKAPTAKN